MSLIRLLISLDFDNDDYSTALLHLRGLLAVALSDTALLQQAEGLLPLSDVWIAMSLGTRPQISPARYDPGPRHLHAFDAVFTRGVDLESPASIIPRPVRPLAESPYGLDQCTIHLLNSVLEILKTKESMPDIEDPFLQQQVVKWMYRRATAVTGYLIIGYVDAIESARIPAQKTSINVRQSIIAASCLTIILFMNLEFCESSSNYNFSKPFQSIEPILRSLTDDIITEHLTSVRELHLWLLFMCALGNDIYSARGDIPYSGWPARTFHRLRNQMQLVRVEHVKQVLEQFLYHDDVVTDFLESLLPNEGLRPKHSLMSWTAWCSILKHYVP